MSLSYMNTNGAEFTTTGATNTYGAFDMGFTNPTTTTYTTGTESAFGGTYPSAFETTYTATAPSTTSYTYAAQPMTTTTTTYETSGGGFFGEGGTDVYATGAEAQQTVQTTVYETQAAPAPTTITTVETTKIVEPAVTANYETYASSNNYYADYSTPYVAESTSSGSLFSLRNLCYLLAGLLALAALGGAIFGLIKWIRKRRAMKKLKSLKPHFDSKNATDVLTKVVSNVTLIPTTTNYALYKQVSVPKLVDITLDNIPPPTPGYRYVLYTNPHTRVKYLYLVPISVDLNSAALGGVSLPATGIKSTPAPVPKVEYVPFLGKPLLKKEEVTAVVSDSSLHVVGSTAPIVPHTETIKTVVKEKIGSQSGYGGDTSVTKESKTVSISGTNENSGIRESGEVLKTKIMQQQQQYERKPQFVERKREQIFGGQVIMSEDLPELVTENAFVSQTVEVGERGGKGI